MSPSEAISGFSTAPEGYRKKYKLIHKMHPRLENLEAFEVCSRKSERNSITDGFYQVFLLNFQNVTHTRMYTHAHKAKVTSKIDPTEFMKTKKLRAS